LSDGAFLSDGAVRSKPEAVARQRLHFVPLEEVVFLAAAALGALKAADEQHRYADCNQYGEDISIHAQPVH
jgi:hypothetical protein